MYNEAENIGPLLDALAVVRTPFELAIAYDSEDDTTLPAIRSREASLPFAVRLLRNAYGRGALGAVKTGLEASTECLAVAVIMADLSDDLAKLDQMFAMVTDDGYDVVCASRYMAGGRQIGGPPLKGLLSRTAGVSLYVLAGVPTHDATNNFKVYRGSFLAATKIESRAGFEIALELTAKAYVGGYRIGEVPATWRDRVAGKSRFDLRKWLPHYLRWYRYAFRRRLPAVFHTSKEVS